MVQDIANSNTLFQNDPKIGLGYGNSIPILDISSKQIYEIFLRKTEQIPPLQKEN